MIRNGIFRAAMLACGLTVAASAAMAGSLPSFRQVGCWNTVVAKCERASDTDERAMCQHTGFSACNKAFDEDGPVSLDRIRDSLPSVTAARVLVRQSAAPVATTHNLQ